jgi:myo-inositol-1(or 4)-monophosphatase
MLTTDLATLLPIANRAVDTAVEILGSAEAPRKLTAKGDRDYATDLDYEIEQRIRDQLGEATPEIGFVGEEEGSSGTRADLVWALDPIDGTVNFVHGLPLYAVSLALVAGDQPVLGVVDLPALRHRYHAAEGLGAHRDGNRLPCPEPPPDVASAIVAIGDYAVGANAAAKNRDRLGVTARLAASVLRVRMLGSAAIDLAWLAEGRLNASVTLSNNTWDMAAGVVLARETGHAVVDGSGQPYNLTSAATLAANAQFLPDLLGSLTDPV